MAVLGIDAAWTTTEPSGVALIEKGISRWRCVAVAASYAEFLDTPDREGDPRGKWPGARLLIEAARHKLGGRDVTLVAADIPLALRPIAGRRLADDAISRAFGAAGCSTHTPSATRPGALADAIRADFAGNEFELATTATPVGTSRRLLEVYPHPAIMFLCRATTRVPYKLSKKRKYWPNDAPAERISRLLTQWELILAGLREHIDEISLELPTVRTGSALKGFEDRLDALVSAWVGAEYLENRAVAYGDVDAAIWLPSYRS